MTDSNVAPGSGDTITIAAPADAPASMTASEAAAVLARARHERRKEQQPAPDMTSVDAGETELPDEGNAALQETEATGETTETTETEDANLPAIEPPRSWTKEARERWESLPRETQEYLATREQDRDREVRRSQNEAAEIRKAVEAEQRALAQARDQYEGAVPLIMQALQEQAAADFADIRTMADVDRMAREDWPRYVQWDAHTKKVQAVQSELATIQQRQASERGQKWSDFASKEDALFLEKVPEFSEPEKARKFSEGAIRTLIDGYGFSESELAKFWNGQGEFSLRDHRAQLLIRDAVRYQDAQAKAKANVIKPLPHVQRPGASAPKGAAQDAQIQALTAKLEKTGSMKDAAALLAARREAASRRR